MSRSLATLSRLLSLWPLNRTPRCPVSGHGRTGRKVALEAVTAERDRLLAQLETARSTTSG